MRPFIAFASVALVLCLAALTTVEGQTTGGSKTDPKKSGSGSDPKKGTSTTDIKKGTTTTDHKKETTTTDSKKGTSGKSSTSSSKKTDTHLNPSLSKGAVTLGAKDLKDVKGSAKTAKGKQPPKQTFYSQQLKTSIDSGQVKLNPSQQTAWNKLAAQQPLSFDDRQSLSELLFKGSQAGLTSQDETALSYLLTDDLARFGGTATPPDPAAPAPSSPLFLRAVNKTNEPVKVFVQIVAKDQGDGSTKKSAAQLETLKYELKPGLAYDLQDKGKQRVKATVIRIWAVSPSRQWASNRDNDLPLTASGTSKVFVVTFAPPAAAGEGELMTTSAGKSK
jgi:hypothetical protein